MDYKINIAILYFSRREHSEIQYKKWFKGKTPSKNRLIASALINKSSQAVRKSGYPVFHYHEGNQTGSTFGERFANAYEEVFQLGYDAIVAVGNDTPELNTINWQTVENELIQGRCVIGPSIRGGAYLIGINKTVFQREGFNKLPWQTNRLFQALVDFCNEREASIHYIQKLRDINSIYDIKALRYSVLVETNFKRLLLFLITGNSKLLVTDTIKISLSQIFAIQLLRAPPVA